MVKYMLRTTKLKGFIGLKKLPNFCLYFKFWSITITYIADFFFFFFFSTKTLQKLFHWNIRSEDLSSRLKSVKYLTVFSPSHPRLPPLSYACPELSEIQECFADHIILLCLLVILSFSLSLWTSHFHNSLWKSANFHLLNGKYEGNKSILNNNNVSFY